MGGAAVRNIPNANECEKTCSKISKCQWVGARETKLNVFAKTFPISSTEESNDSSRKSGRRRLEDGQRCKNIFSKSWTWVQNSRECWLKSKKFDIKWLKPKNTQNKHISGSKSLCIDLRSFKPIIFRRMFNFPFFCCFFEFDSVGCKFKGMDMPGHDVGVRRGTQSADQCALYCQLDPNCKWVMINSKFFVPNHKFQKENWTKFFFHDMDMESNLKRLLAEK